ncbi:thiamine pyrophosphate-binding protein [Parahaliea mediterranea]|uniref:thiamine pyrophosphate-binding protein n=1 Tax=Parahaliea mediterranea TaxID=651086 RepID=UPI000E2ED7C3|nr:thiamine pyrophosphate-binding protein [Parahaliea mediterranea]
MSTQALGERIADLLLGEGVDRFFSLPEVTFGKLHDALDRRGAPLIAPHHEAAAGYMAEAYAQLTGRMAVVGGSVGPGAINLYPVIANSWSENLPILYLGSERTVLARNSPRRSQFQCPPNLEVVKPITKYCAMIENPLEADAIFQEAFRQLHTGTPGPVYIGLPFDLLLEEHDFGPLAPPQRYRPASFVDTVCDADLAALAEELVASPLPLILAGAGLRLSRMQAALEQLARALGCPVITTPAGRGVLPDTHPQLFDLGVAPGSDIAAQADTVLVLGSSISEQVAFGGQPYARSQQGFPNFFGDPATQRWIHIDRDPAALGRNRPVDVALAGDLRRVMPRLVDAVQRAGAEPERNAKRLGTWQQAREAHYRSLYSATTDSQPIHPGRAIVEVQRALPEQAIIVRDGGAFKIWAMNLLHHPISENLAAIKQGMLGSGVPYGLGAALAARDDGRRVCVITGDGAFGFYPMELETAVRHNLPVVIVVGYDAGWSLEVPYYMQVCGRTFEVDHEFVRLDEMARTLGAHGEFCTRSDEIGPAMQRALAAQKPALVQIVIDRDINAYQMPNNGVWSSWHADKAVYQ